MKTLTIGWLNKCRCGNKSHSVKTARGNNAALWDDDAVKCNSCGRGGVIQACEGQARVLWETDEEMAEGKPTSTITKEWLQKAISQHESMRDEIPFGLDEDDSNTLAALRIALASLEAEAVAWRSLYYENHGLLTGSKNVLASWQKQGWKCEPLYTAPPVPVSVPDEATPDNIQMLASTYAPRGVTYQWDSDECNAAADSWNACRAAMLQGVENAESPTTLQTALELDYSQKNAESTTGINQGKSEPVTTAYKLPANTPCKDAPEYIWLQTAGVWPENGEFSELTWCSDNQHTDDTLYVRADVVADNSPVIPDGWVMVPVDMTPEQMRAVQIESELGSYSAANLSGTYALFREFWDVAIAAAPQQEVKP